ncbi:hypothetical protein GCM10009839_66740 [Catenulispora yoronensis]|uniref:Uncharacterized protein n=1 Tax=Catenulispora yoronensis TaxID=450799 RepID=A0ABN2V4R3_9ACTN
MGTATIAAAILAGPSAYASGGGGGGGGGGRPCGPTHNASGSGSHGTGWTLKSKYDDDGAKPGVVVGEEFQINTQAAGQVWHVQLADNGLVFFDKVLTSTTAGITAMSNTPDQGGTDQVMTATATNQGSGETITNATLTVPGPPPAACGQGAG